MNRRLENQVETVYQYDDGDRVLEMDHILDLVAGINSPNYKPSTLASVQYSYDAAGNPIFITRDGRTASYNYDSLNRLTQEIQGTTGLTAKDSTLCPSCPTPDPKVSLLSYDYDAAGNRVKQTRKLDGKTVVTTYNYASNGSNELSGFSDSAGLSRNYQYDATGNLTWRSGQNLSYDEAGRLVSAGTVDGTGYVDFDYDGEGERVRERPNGGISDAATAYIYDGLQVIADVQANNGTVKASYVVGLGQVVRKTTTSPALNGKAWNDYFLNDALGSVILTVDNQAKVQERRSYEPFGKDTGAPGEHRQGFTGQEQQADIGLYYYHARWMYAEVGRFGQADPLVRDNLVPGDWNQFVYVRNCPTTAVDPTGKIGRWLSDVSDFLTGEGYSNPEDSVTKVDSPFTDLSGQKIGEVEKVLLVETSQSGYMDPDATLEEMRAIGGVIKKRAECDGTSVEKTLQIRKFVEGYPFESGSDQANNYEEQLAIAGSPKSMYRTNPDVRLNSLMRVNLAIKVANEMGDGSILSTDPIPQSTNFRTKGDLGSDFSDETKWNYRDLGDTTFIWAK
jgi:RHS repeat-associated protein